MDKLSRFFLSTAALSVVNGKCNSLGFPAEEPGYAVASRDTSEPQIKQAEMKEASGPRGSAKSCRANRTAALAHR